MLEECNRFAPNNTNQLQYAVYFVKFSYISELSFCTYKLRGVTYQLKFTIFSYGQFINYALFTFIFSNEMLRVLIIVAIHLNVIWIRRKSLTQKNYKKQNNSHDLLKFQKFNEIRNSASSI